jgi:hypothetical protein
MQEWDFAVLATAHNGVLKHEAKARVLEMFEEAKPKLEYHAQKWRDGVFEVPEPESPDRNQRMGGWSNDETMCECG